MLLTTLLGTALIVTPIDSSDFVLFESDKYSFEVPRGWSVGKETPWGARDITTKSDSGKFGAMTAGPTQASWDELYQTSLYFIKREGKDDYWLNLGVCFAHDDGEGFNLLLQALPIDGKIVLRTYKDEEKKNQSIRYAWAEGLVDMVTVGFEKTAELDDFATRLGRVPLAEAKAAA